MVKDLGPLDWKTPIVDGTGRPSPEFQRRWNTQRSNNSGIGAVAIGAGPPPADPTPTDGQEYVDVSATPLVLYVGSAGAWDKVGVLAFTDLSDVPHAYTGAGGQLLHVKGTEDGLGFITLSALLDALMGSTEGDLLVRGSAAWEALAAGTSGNVLTSNGPGAVPSWQPASGGGGGGRMLFDLPTMPALSGFTQVGVSGSVSAVENAGKAITLVNSMPPTDSGIFTSGLALAVPVSTPYRVAVFGLLNSFGNNYGNISVGFRDSSTGKIELIVLYASLTTSSGGYGAFSHEKWNSNTSRATVSVLTMSANLLSPGAWIGVHDNGTNIIFEFAADGATFAPILSAAKSGGFLANYDQIYIGAEWDDNVIGSRQQSVSFLAYDPNGLTRTVG